MTNALRKKCWPKREGDYEGSGSIRFKRWPFKLRNDILLCNRMKICLLATCLMWATSLKVAVFVASFFIDVPPFEFILKSCQAAYDISREEKKHYDDCVDMQLDRCNKDLIKRTYNLASKTDILAARNEKIVKKAKNTQSSCSSAYNSLRYSLESWTSTGRRVPLMNTTCEDEERTELTSMVGDLSSVRSEAFSLSTQYSDESQIIVTKLSGYAEARATYDVDYIGNHTHVVQDKLYKYAKGIDVPLMDMTGMFDEISADVDSLMSCVSLRNVNYGSCPYFEGAQELLADIRERVDTRLDIYVNELQAFYAAVDQYTSNVYDAYKISKKFFDETKYIVNKYLLTALFRGGWFEVPVSSFLPDDVQFPSSIPTFDVLPTIDSVWDSVSPAFDAFNKKMTLITANADQRAQALKSSVESAILHDMPELTPEDYNPPKYLGSSQGVKSTADEQLIHSQKSKSFVERSAIALDAFSQLNQRYEVDDNKTSQHLSFVNISAVGNKPSNIDLSFERLLSPDIDLNIWFLQFTSLGDLMFLLDFSFRVFCTIRLFAKYWSVGALKMPDVDLRTKREWNNPLGMSYMKQVALLATNPLLSVLLCALFGGWLMTITYSIYSPLHNAYMLGCVPHKGNGTFVTNNLFSVAYNYAYQDGSGDLVAGLESFDSEKEQICTSLYTSSAKRQNDNTAVLSTLTNAHNKYMENMDLLKRCINIENINADFDSVCCGLEGYRSCRWNEIYLNRTCPINELVNPPAPFPPPGSYLAEESCTVGMYGNNWQLSDAVFHCEKLPACDVTCKGPHKEKIRAVTNECGCTIEWYIHSILLQVALALVIYASCNVSRISLIEGFSRLMWKRLHPDLFTVLFTYKRDGEAILQKSSQGCGKCYDCSSAQKGKCRGGVKEEVRSNVERKIRFFQLSGVPIIIFALLINVPWIYFLTTTMNSTKPDWLR